MFKLYYTAGTCALASHITLEEVGADYSTVRISFDANQQNSPEYLAINPKGRIPSLITDRGILTETPAMLAFIAQSFPQAKLAPFDDAFAFAQVQSFNSFICSSLHVAHAHRMRGIRALVTDAHVTVLVAVVVLGARDIDAVPVRVTGSRPIEHDIGGGRIGTGHLVERITVLPQTIPVLHRAADATACDEKSDSRKNREQYCSTTYYRPKPLPPRNISRPDHADTFSAPAQSEVFTIGLTTPQRWKCIRL